MLKRYAVGPKASSKEFAGPHPYSEFAVTSSAPAYLASEGAARHRPHPRFPSDAGAGGCRIHPFNLSLPGIFHIHHRPYPFPAFGSSTKLTDQRRRMHRPTVGVLFPRAATPTASTLLTVGLVAILLLGSSFLSGCSDPPDSADPEAPSTVPASTMTPKARNAAADSVRALLQQQQQGWNRGDLEAFMQGYAAADTLRFASGGSVQTGWQTTLDRYRTRYPDRSAMGRLAFDRLDVDVIDPTWAMAFGRWRLERANDAPQGLFTLILRRPSPTDPWRIVHDHTSSADVEPSAD